MRPSDVRRDEHIQVNIEDLSEDEAPQPGLPQPVVGTEEFIKVTKWRINKVFGFLTATAGACLWAVAAAPNVTVLVAAVAIWAGSVFLARFLLAGTYRNSNRNHKDLIEAPTVQ